MAADTAVKCPQCRALLVALAPIAKGPEADRLGRGSSYADFAGAPPRDDNPYSHASQEVFVASCQNGGATERSCRCAFDWIKQNVSVADFKAYAHLVTPRTTRPRRRRRG